MQVTIRALSIVFYILLQKQFPALRPGSDDAVLEHLTGTGSSAANVSGWLKKGQAEYEEIPSGQADKVETVETEMPAQHAAAARETGALPEGQSGTKESGNNTIAANSTVIGINFVTNSGSIFPKYAFIGVNFVLIAIGLLTFKYDWGAFGKSGPNSVGGAPECERAFLGLETWSQVAIFFLYVTFACTHTFFQRRSGVSGYSVMSATILIYALKCVVALIMFYTRGDGSFAPLFQPGVPNHPILGRIPAFVLLALPGALYAIYDVLSFMALAEVDPVTYQVFRSLRIVGIVIAWQPALGNKLTISQCSALFFFTAASVSKGIDQLSGEGFSSARLGMIILSGQIAISIVANVASELLLKKLRLHTDLLNTCQYFESLLILLALLAIVGPKRAIQTELLAWTAWQTLYADKWMMYSIVCLAALGIITAYFLRELSNILKELSFSFVIVITALVEWRGMGASACTYLGMQAVAFSIIAIFVYNANPISTKPPPETPSAAESNTEGACRAKTERCL